MMRLISEHIFINGILFTTTRTSTSGAQPSIMNQLITVYAAALGRLRVILAMMLLVRLPSPRSFFDSTGVYRG